MNTKRKLLIGAILGLLLVLAAFLLGRRRGRTHPTNQPPIDI